jgi:hypothetical protein
MPVAVEIRERAAPPAQFKRSFKPGAVAIDPIPRGAIGRAPAVAGAGNFLKRNGGREFC